MIYKFTHFLSLTFMLVLIPSAWPGHPSQLPNTSNQYQLRRPLRYMYYRLNSKIQINPMIGHIAKNKQMCSSKLGPYCEVVNKGVLQEYRIMEEQLVQLEKNSYRVQQYYQPARFLLSQQIERTHTYFLPPTNQYKIVDNVVKKSVKQLMFKEEIQYVQTQNQKKDTKK